MSQRQSSPSNEVTSLQLWDTISPTSGRSEIRINVISRLHDGPRDGDVVTNSVPLPVILTFSGPEGKWPSIDQTGVKIEGSWHPPRFFDQWTPYVWHLYRLEDEEGLGLALSNYKYAGWTSV